MVEALQKKKVNVVNLYFGAALIVLILTTALLISMLKSQSGVNYQAKLLVEQTETYVKEISQQKDDLQEIQRTMAVASTEQALPLERNTNQITRMLDDYFSSLPGNAVNSTLNFTDFRTSEELGLMYTDATLTLTSSESNFYEFLRYAETSGLSSDGSRNLMEVRSINITFNNDDEAQLNYRVTLRIYFSPGLTSVTTEEETQ